MVDSALYAVDGAHVLRAYLLYKIRNDMSMLRLTDGYPYDPFIPSQQYREMVDLSSGKPFIVYTYTTSDDYPAYWMSIENLVLKLYGDEHVQLTKLKNYVRDLLTNEWTPTYLTDYAKTSAIIPFRMFTFHTMQVTMTVGPEPYEQEGGRQAASLAIRYTYTVNEDNNQFRA
jgi:hypothetical protein